MLRAVGNGRSLFRTNTHLLPYLAVGLAVVAMGSSAVFIRLANMPGPLFGLYRMMIAVTLSSVIFKRRVGQSLPLSRAHVGFAVFGGVFLALDMWVYNEAILVTSAANANLFSNTSVIWVALASVVLLKERLRPAFWGGLVLALVGITVILGQDLIAHPALGFGDLLGILTGPLYAIYFLATARARHKLEAVVTWWISSLASALALLGISLALGLPFFGYSLQSYACIVIVAVLTQVGGYLSVNYALGHLPPTRVSISLTSQPIVTAILGVILLGQAIGMAQVLGGALVLSGIYLVHRTRQAG